MNSTKRSLIPIQTERSIILQLISTSISKKNRKTHEASIRNKYAYMELPPFECDKGWNKLIEALCETLSIVDKDKEIRVQQIKEKYASLRFYINVSSDKFNKIIGRFEDISFKTCEVCGNEGRRRVNKDFLWYKTLCDRHAKKLGYTDIVKSPRQKSTTVSFDIKRDEDYVS